MIDLSNPSLRSQILQETESAQNKERKSISLAQFEIYRDRLLPYVREYLKSFYSEQAIKEMPIVASVNLCKRIVDKEAGVYASRPKREFVGVTEEQAKTLEQIYSDMRVDVYMKKANRFYKLQEQNHLQVQARKGELRLRSLLSHQIDVVPDLTNPEDAMAYIVKGFDRAQYVPTLSDQEDGINQMIGDVEDYKGTQGQCAWWSDIYNFITDENGKIVSGENILNPLGILPFIEISDAKDSEYWNRKGAATTDFTIQFNGALSDLGQIVRMQGFSQAVIKGGDEVLAAMQNVQIGPNFVLKLPINPNNPVDTDFTFATPNPDLAGSIQYLEMMLSSFLSSRGLDASLVNTKGNSKNYTSGMERLLAMIEMFQPSRDDFALFEKAEKKLFKIVKAYLNTYAGTDVLNYSISQLPDSADVNVKFAEPQAIMSEQELIDSVKTKIEMGVMSQVEAIAEIRGVSLEKAQEIKSLIDGEQIV